MAGATPYLFSPDCEKHILWLEKVFNAEVREKMHHYTAKEKIMHVRLSINGGKIMMADEYCYFLHHETWQQESFKNRNRGFMTCIEVKPGEGQRLWKKGIENGGKVKNEFKRQDWGGSLGIFEDPFGFEWMITEKDKHIR